MSEGIINLSDATFDEVVKSADKPVLVDFWAEWCGPCKMIEPVLKDIDLQHGDRITIARLNVDDCPEVARRFEVMSIPTLIVFKDGAPAARVVGARGKGQLLEELRPFMDAA